MNATGLGPNSPAMGDAVASLGLNLARCSREDDPIPTTTTLLDPIPQLATLLDLPLGTLLRCGGTLLRFQIVPETGRLRLVPTGRLAQVLTPRLIG